MHFNSCAYEQGPYILKMKKLFFAKLKVQGLGHLQMPFLTVYVFGNPCYKDQRGPAP